MALSLVYITARNRAEARKIGSLLVRERLAASANILGPIDYVYRWKGKVRNDREVALIAKTREARLPALIRRVRAVHSYDVPCIVALPIGGGNAAFLKWVEEETAL